MRAIVYRAKASAMEYMAIGINRWTTRADKARVFTNTGHAKNALNYLMDYYGSTQVGWRYYVLPVVIVPQAASDAEEYL